MDKKNNHQGLYRVAYICYSEVEKEDFRNPGHI